MRAVHPYIASTVSFRRRLVGAAALAVMAMMTLVPATAAVASVGSTPPDVTSFATDDDGLLVELEEFFGVDQRGTGLDFSDGIEIGEVDRVFLWSNDYHSGQVTETAVQYVNRWMVPVTIGEEPVGVALIGIDPATVDPEMIDFIRSPGVALALDDVDDDATLVQEPETGAWFSLIDETITPLVRGTSEVAGEVTLEAYQPIVSTRPVEVVEESPQPDQGAVQSVVLIVTTVIVVLLALLIPTILGQVRERRERRAAEEGSTEEEQAEKEATEEAAAADSDVDMVADSVPLGSDDAGLPVTKEAATVGAQSGFAPAKVAEAKTPAAKTPAAKKPAAKKPATKKPVATKAAVKKAPAAKAPVARKPAAKKPATKATPKTTTKTTIKAPQESTAKTTVKRTAQSTAASASSTAAKKVPAKTTPAKKAPAKTAPAKTTPAKKAPAKKAPAKKTPATSPTALQPVAKKATPSTTSKKRAQSTTTDVTDSSAD
ncbi:hypothetical protein [Salinibacterium sp. NK8237]|uniref:hypothetical protein n=1 Tax=Salinibacterium sp. NK8237 TaxID=2792038 RepID=UPI0018CCED78|nr:hypothetical protein [Salinibacterium sp. NK8237]MBH0130949.1 hypothetical protein [Salinibacterium sp. NK8237]